MAYIVKFKRSAAKSFEKLSDRLKERLSEKLALLEAGEQPPSARRLQGCDDLWRLRVGDYRAIYASPNEDDVVYVLKIGHRRAVYRLH